MPWPDLRISDAAVSGVHEIAIALDPSRNAAYASLGAIQFAQGKRNEAEATFKKAVDGAPRSIDARLALGNFYWASGRMAESEQTLKDALDIDAKNIVANRALERLLHGHGPSRGGGAVLQAGSRDC